VPSRSKLGASLVLPKELGKETGNRQLLEGGGVSERPVQNSSKRCQGGGVAIESLEVINSLLGNAFHLKH